jgi:hypothetical protein
MVGRMVGRRVGWWVGNEVEGEVDGTVGWARQLAGSNVELEEGLAGRVAHVGLAGRWVGRGRGRDVGSRQV